MPSARRACDSVRPFVCFPVHEGRRISVACGIGDSGQGEGLLPLGALVAAAAAVLSVNGIDAGKAELEWQRFADADDLFLREPGEGSQYLKWPAKSFGEQCLECGKKTRAGVR